MRDRSRYLHMPVEREKEETRRSEKLENIFTRDRWREEKNRKEKKSRVGRLRRLKRDHSTPMNVMIQNNRGVRHLFLGNVIAILVA